MKETFSQLSFHEDILMDFQTKLNLLRQSDRELLKRARVDTFRGSGRGGQKRNKTSNAVRIVFDHWMTTETGSRSKEENIKKGLKKLRLLIALEIPKVLPEPSTLAMIPPEISPYLGGGQIGMNPKNPLYPLLLLVLFEYWMGFRGDWSSGAKQLKISTTQFRRFFEKEPKLLEKRKVIEQKWNQLDS